MTRTEILKKITDVLADVLDNDKLQLTEATTADSVEDWDSINHVRMLIALESDYGFQFETDEVGGVKDVGGLIDLVQSRLAK